MSFNLPITIASDKATHIVVYHENQPTVHSDSNSISELRRQLYDLTKEMNELTKRVLKIELNEQPLPRKSPFFAPALAPEPSGLEVRRLSEAIPVDTSDSKTVFATVVKMLPTTDLDEVNEEEVEPDAEEQEEEEVEEEVEEEEDEAMELEEFDYKGVTYYRDGENQVYQKDADGDLDDTPIGVWNETKQKVIKYAKA